MVGSVSNILKKQMTRKEFVSYMGVIILTLLGIPSLLKPLSDLGVPQKRKKGGGIKHTFGSGAYGA